MISIVVCDDQNTFLEHLVDMKHLQKFQSQGAVLDDGTTLRAREKSCNMVTPPYFDTVAFGVCGGYGGVSGRGYHLKTNW